MPRCPGSKFVIEALEYELLRCPPLGHGCQSDGPAQPQGRPSARGGAGCCAGGLIPRRSVSSRGADRAPDHAVRSARTSGSAPGLEALCDSRGSDFRAQLPRTRKTVKAYHDGERRYVTRSQTCPRGRNTYLAVARFDHAGESRGGERSRGPTSWSIGRSRPLPRAAGHPLAHHPLSGGPRVP